MAKRSSGEHWLDREPISAGCGDMVAAIFVARAAQSHEIRSQNESHDASTTTDPRLTVPG
jgi:hypothetical protein